MPVLVPGLEPRRARSQRPAEHMKSPHNKLLRKCVADEKALRGSAADQVSRKGNSIVRIAGREGPGRERRWKMRLVRADRNACKRWRAWNQA
eukprot:scaffold12886_cov73-Phaeocystis_antarctica.AAC.2